VGTVLLALGVALVAGAGVLLATCLGVRSTVGFLLTVYLLASAEVVVGSLALSLVGAFARTALLVVFGGWFVLAGLVWLRRGRPRAQIHVVAPVREALRDRAVAVLAAAAVLTDAYAFVVALSVPQSVPDTMLYHLPRAAFWTQQHAVAYVPNAPDGRINVFPPVAEIEAAVSMSLSRGDRFVGLVQVLALIGACLAIAGIARRLGFGLSAAAFGALAFATFTVVVLQTPTALNDLVVASFLVVCAYFAMGSSRMELALAALALALAVGTKGTAAFAIPALALFAFASQPRRRWWAIVALGAAGIAAGSFWFALNLVEAGHVTGGVTADRGVNPLRDRVWKSVADLLELSDGENTALLASPLWGLGLLAVALVVGLVLWRRSRAAAGVAVLIGAIAFVAAPMLVTWARVTARIVAHAANAVGLDVTAPAGRLPTGFVESPMHSSFGLAFVILLLGAGVLVVADVARRRLPLAALAAVCGVPLTLLVTALALAYDPQRMRYIVFAAALAAADFGIALRVRALAWATVAATVVSLAVSVAYFIPRPAGLALLPGNRSPELSARWFVQAGGGGGDGVAFRFLEERIPDDATIALDLARNTYVYPAWDAHLRRTVRFVSSDGVVPDDAGWLVVGPSRTVDEQRLEDAGWKRELVSPRQWRIYGR
jgi:Dolichyl-phosphate-mannose-protein mannosyltransferase